MSLTTISPLSPTAPFQAELFAQRPESTPIRVCPAAVAVECGVRHAEAFRQRDSQPFVALDCLSKLVFEFSPKFGRLHRDMIPQNLRFANFTR